MEKTETVQFYFNDIQKYFKNRFEDKFENEFSYEQVDDYIEALETISDEELLTWYIDHSITLNTCYGWEGKIAYPLDEFIEEAENISNFKIIDSDYFSDGIEIKISYKLNN